MRIVFRFCVVYFTLFFLFTQIFLELVTVPVSIFFESYAERLAVDIWSWRGHISDPVVRWIGVHVLGMAEGLKNSRSMGGDRPYDWVLLVAWSSVAAAVTLIWTVLDRHRVGYPVLYRWFRVFVRFGLAFEMFRYGAVKVFPNQMSAPDLTTLLMPYGYLTPMEILWNQVGSAPVYEILLGTAELLGGVLLVIPRTNLLGALLCLVEMLQVFVLNMTFDVPVKLFSFHLVLLCLILLAPEARRVTGFFLGNGSAPSVPRPRLFRAVRAERAALVAQLLIGVLLLGSSLYLNWERWARYGSEQPKPLLYGIWNVEELVADGQSRPPLLTDRTRIRRFVVDRPAEFVTVGVTALVRIQLNDDSIKHYFAVENRPGATMQLTTNEGVTSVLSFRQSTPDRLVIDGKLDGHQLHMEMRSIDPYTFPVHRGGRFRWVHE